MSVVAIITLDGDPDALLRMYDKQDEATRDLPTKGLISHLAARTATGLLMVDVWESGEHLETFMAQPQFQAELQVSGFPEPEIDVYEIDRQQ